MVSGANRGIGLAIALALYHEGYSLSLGARDLAALEQAMAAADDRQRLLYCRFEAEDRASQQAWLGATLERYGRLDGLVNNAGIGVPFTLEQGEEAALDKIWAVNVKAPLFLTRLCLPQLKASGCGRVINVASLSGKRVRNDNVAYNMSKFAMLALSHGTRRAGWDDGVRVTALCPSFVRTDMTAAATKIPREEMIDPDDLARLAVTVMALPNTAAVAELLVNCRLEDTL
jgi:NAD(P)-dependent dehydrogenase (short-subunit alcohol dehydrogenase family)